MGRSGGRLALTFTLDFNLAGGCSEKIYPSLRGTGGWVLRRIRGVVAASTEAAIAAGCLVCWRVIVDVVLWRRHVGARQVAGRCCRWVLWRLWSGEEKVLGVVIRPGLMALRRKGQRGLHVTSSFATAGVGITVDARVSGKFVGAREAFLTAGELAGVRLFASVGANMAGLML